MDKEMIRRMLPEEPRGGMLKWVVNNCQEELGPDYLVWKPVRVPVYDMETILTGKRASSRWVAHCTCLKCGSQMYTEYSGSTLEFWLDECGEWWPLDPARRQPFDEENQEMGYMVEVNDGEQVCCPMCYETVNTIRARNLRGGRRKQILVGSIETVEGYAAVVYWLARREIFEDSNTYTVYPRDAYVLDERGTIHRYTHTTGGGSFSAEKHHPEWRISTSKRDSLDSVYHDWGSMSNRKKGGVFYENVPDLDGTTAEKTGLWMFAMADGTYSVEYLKLWKKNRNLENLSNTRWLELVNDIVQRSFDGYYVRADLSKVIDVSKAKPHEMLGISKGDFKQICRNGWQWGYEEQELYRKYRETGGTSALEFRGHLQEFRKEGIRTVAEIQKRYGDGDFGKIKRYLQKQQIRPSEVRILLDTRNAAAALAGGRALTFEELWPRNLQATHDRLTRARLMKIDPDKAAKYQQGFDEVLDKYGDLQWNDGELCIVLPRGHADLVQEGAVLRHCVGGYSEDHIRGRDTIFFVRKYRRPERSYYTLDINMTDRPHRVQLHGYGNERHGVHKEHSHKIPKKVLDFCDRWEREVLQPWYRDQQNKQKEGVSA